MEQLVVITGLSGSGKSLAARCLEDLGFFCVDNLPVLLIPPFHKLIHQSEGRIHRAALVIDARERGFLPHFPDMLRHLRSRNEPVNLLFFECSDQVLKRRFSETRRPHPMASAGGTLEAAIQAERSALRPLRDLADRIIDTGDFTVHQLRAFLKSAFAPRAPGTGLNVNVISFGFKYGVPAEADLVLDVRFLPNPYFEEELRSLDGTDPRVRRFVEAPEESRRFMQKVEDFLEFLLPLYQEEGKSYLTVALGCTGGKHRSVALAVELTGYLEGRGVTASAHHRDLGKE